jgi:selenocysteine lyase/cysteine desulfurase
MPAFNRRSFLNAFSTLTAGTLFSSFTRPGWESDVKNALIKAENRPAGQLAADEDFWLTIRNAYTASESILNLNNGGVAPSPKIVQDAVKRYMDMSNEAPSYFMWRIIDKGREPLRKGLADLAGCLPDELALQRNATEALDTIIFGLSLKAGDEVVLCKQDYPAMIQAWKQREKRDGIKLVWVNLQLPSEDNDYLTNAYTKLFTAKTKVVHVTHVLNWNGQVLPVRRIADAAHTRNIEVVVDGAHSFAQFPYTIPEIGADYFGASLHKWLSACIGTGILYVKKEKISKLYPLFAAVDNQESDIRKFEHLGTRPFFIEQATFKAIEFYEMIGAERKQQRLHYLKNYWMNKVKDIPGVRLGTSFMPGFGCAIGIVGIDGITPKDLETLLQSMYFIHTTPVDWENIKGVRITPNVYTLTRDLDRLVDAITDISKGIKS